MITATEMKESSTAHLVPSLTFIEVQVASTRDFKLM